ncbi:MAG TPA: biotin carboxylase N-terminal domain-containing protein [Acidimicrobiales bacterium]|nr:biotin carboxylase N-terminal domain-containing protein [Acidimicrobiales bacterium]
MRIRRLLVANRGEIALRILRTCERLGVETVLAASDADLDSPAARRADLVVRLGPSPPRESYLSVDAVVRAARAAGATAVHPGYGFLSENPALAVACAEAGLIFVGPSAEHLRALGDKLQARALAVAAGLPILPGGEVASAGDAEAMLTRTGLPVLVKAVGGGGGRGMRLVSEARDLAGALDLSTAEARGAFGDGRVYLERHVAHGRHVEVQLLADGERVLHVGERDCSVQRRYQKLLEEAPAPALSETLRAAILDAAVRLGRHLGYRGLGTVEFLVDVDRDDFFFLEVNPRIQVEHPVTEETTGLDLVAEQLYVAEDRPLSLYQHDIVHLGHAIECRINAEDPDRDFAPVPGAVTGVRLPAGEGVRVDTGVQAGSNVPPYYDSLVAKLVVWGSDRAAALARLASALDRMAVEGIATTLPLHRRLVAAPELLTGGVDTGWLRRFLDEGSPAEATVPGVPATLERTGVAAHG